MRTAAVDDGRTVAEMRFTRVRGIAADATQNDHFGRREAIVCIARRQLDSRESPERRKHGMARGPPVTPRHPFIRCRTRSFPTK